MGYSSSMTGYSFWLQETKKTASCMLEGLTKDEISKLAIDENIYQVNTPERSGEISKVTYRRLNIFPKDILECFLKTDVESAKIFVLISIMSVDELFFEFMNEVFKDHIILGNYILEKKEVLSFLQKKQLESEKVASWTDNTINELVRAYRTLLFEAGIFDLKTNQILIPFIDYNLVKLLKDEGFGSYIETIEI